jgi:hypothetical protein
MTNCVRLGSICVLALLVLLPAPAAVIVDQTPINGFGYVAQDFPDYPANSTHLFDDVTVTQSWSLTTLTVLGIEGVGGDPTKNIAVTGEIWTGLPGSGTLLFSSVSGVESGADLVLDFGGQVLDPGTYWITAYVTRPFGNGGQWFLGTSNQAVSGSEAYAYNPGGAFNFGTTPVPISTAFVLPEGRDLAFTLNGEPAGVPEPSTFALMGAGCVLLAFARRRA